MFLYANIFISIAGVDWSTGSVSDSLFRMQPGQVTCSPTPTDQRGRAGLQPPREGTHSPRTSKPGREKTIQENLCQWLMGNRAAFC